MDGYLREKQRKLKAAYGMMTLKCGVCALPFLVLAVCIALLWLADFGSAPSTWQAAQVRFSHMGEVKVFRGRSGTGRSPALMTADGGAYVLTRDDAERLAGCLLGGEQCSIVYSHEPDGYTHLQALTRSGEVLVERAAHEKNWQDNHHQTGMIALVFMGLAAAAAGLGYILWARRDWDSVNRLRRDIEVRRAKNAVREANKRTRKGG